MISAAASSTSLVEIPGRTNSVTRSRISLAVRQAFLTTLTATAQARGLETALKSQELALRAAQSGYRVGTKANADVLDAQSRLFDVRRDLARARYDAWNGFIKLKVLTGAANDGDMAQLNGLLVEMPTPQMTEKTRASVNPAPRTTEPNLPK